MKKLSSQETVSILEVLEGRFQEIKERFPDLNWTDLRLKLEQNPDKLRSLYEMEETGGDPDLLEYNKDVDEFIFCDFSKESPKGRRSLCYDKKALESRKKFKPADNAQDVASRMGVDLMNEEDYRKLQSYGEFDTKTSSWLETPENIRKLGGAIFGDFRYGKVFIYHNGAESYYAARGFRGILKL
ncbi:DUF4256 domain-containing protein [Christiangramia echinicola]|uniref:DUF4256 domain-containing protein n=1 Tax=Christiangramia echinicola TaxID=279359 RepID=A0A1H1REW3_9FLAO|nr:DUF4256 domain-containing protein [Christiangramia echinicola]SDS33469.1 Protein of unknown function [Christiangramia echinicola]